MLRIVPTGRGACRRPAPPVGRPSRGSGAAAAGSSAAPASAAWSATASGPSAGGSCDSVMSAPELGGRGPERATRAADPRKRMAPSPPVQEAARLGHDGGSRTDSEDTCRTTVTGSSGSTWRDSKASDPSCPWSSASSRDGPRPPCRPRSGRTSPEVPATRRPRTPTCAPSPGYGLMPRMLTGAAQRDLSVELFGQRLPTPLMFAPVGVIGLCSDDGHGDLATARAASAGRRTDDRVDPVAGSARGRGVRPRRHPGLVPALPAQRPRADRESRTPGRGRRLPGDRDHARHPHAGLATSRSRPRQLPAAQGPVPGHLLQRPRLPQQAGGAAGGGRRGGYRAVGDDLRQPEPDLGRPGLAPLPHPTPDPAQGHLLTGRRPPRGRRRDGRHLLLQPRRSAGQRRTARAGLPGRGRRRRRRPPGGLRLRRAERSGHPQGTRSRRLSRRRSAAPTPTGWRSAGSPASSTSYAACSPRWT